MVARSYSKTGQRAATWPTPAAVLELLKPITWFPPMWAYGCGMIASGADLGSRWAYVTGGILLAGPMICGTSQAVNDWYDRHVDAINEPHRVIPSGRMPGRWGLWVAITGSLLSLALAALLGMWVFVAAVIGILFAWIYSMPPLRLKQDGWQGNAAVGLSYETLPWLTAVAATTNGLPDWRTGLIALLYGLGAHGIMTLNDFKAIEGDRQMGIRSLPARYGPQAAAKLACITMAVAQVAVIVALLIWGRPFFGAAIAGLTLVQLVCMARFLKDPIARAVWYSAIGVGLYVTGMVIAAFALRGLVSA
ncbi:chlorophyll synthase ChlG [Stappia sp. ES.058]|uniref:chlorophyll synthase ChlG n=1 Tax=Stappia sp. ES.058 TaxID=1881061 RepID=UPI00087A1006|nr:chlorophyll synthase ChlG [Stappia sp. ES.058]SDT96054.1 chlorophyll synthase [Stappia sp. ES.058]